ncbi:hypothetical protein pb186bvf_019500 [Paramecium bursaria]
MQLYYQQKSLEQQEGEFKAFKKFIKSIVKGHARCLNEYLEKVKELSAINHIFDPWISSLDHLQRDLQFQFQYLKQYEPKFKYAQDEIQKQMKDQQRLKDLQKELQYDLDLENFKLFKDNSKEVMQNALTVIKLFYQKHYFFHQKSNPSSYKKEKVQEHSAQKEPIKMDFEPFEDETVQSIDEQSELSYSDL